MEDHPHLPLCVDLDGTLIKTDLLIESIVIFLKQSPWKGFYLLLWLFRGKSYLKYQLSIHVVLRPDLLPYHQDVLELIKTRRMQGGKAFLCSASNESVVEQVAQYLGVFNGVYGSSKTLNVKAKVKADQLVKTFGEKKFDYVGNEACDYEVFKKAQHAFFVTDSRSKERKIAVKGIVFEKVFYLNHHVKMYIKLLRVHHWAKNVLVFLPILLSHQITNPVLFGKAFLSFILISLLASGTYVLNDILDLDADRSHRIKKNRPLAIGAISLVKGAAIACLLTLLSGLGGFFFAPKILIFLVSYFVVTVSYSLWCKKIVMLDVLILAFLHTVRIIMGAVVIGETVSEWLFSFSIFLFCSLGFVKRYSEIYHKERSAISQENTQVPGRGYIYGDLYVIQMLGIGLGGCSILIFVLYISSETVKNLYQVNYWLWLVAPVLLYWLGRLWILTSRGEVNEDPILFSIKDKMNYALLAIIIVCLLLANYGVNVL
ncbi:MAG: UbiA family prenyltransferase [Bdellovibrionota bacterium]